MFNSSAECFVRGNLLHSFNSFESNGSRRRLLFIRLPDFIKRYFTVHFFLSAVNFIMIIFFQKETTFIALVHLKKWLTEQFCRLKMQLLVADICIRMIIYIRLEWGLHRYWTITQQMSERMPFKCHNFTLIATSHDLFSQGRQQQLAHQAI